LVVADSSGSCLVVAVSLWFVIILKSKDRFMERPPMKTVQPRALCGYGLAQYVVETSFDIPKDDTDCVGVQSVWLEMCGFVCSQHP
jgi:hypothetical protein